MSMKSKICFHKWKKRDDVARECSKCGAKEINVWGQWCRVKTQREFELYEAMLK